MQFSARGDHEVVEALERGFAQGGYEGAMRLAAETLEERSRTTYVAPPKLASLYFRAGDHDRALDWLKRGYEERNPNMYGVVVDPLYYSLREDPRFQDLLLGMNLTGNENFK